MIITLVGVCINYFCRIREIQQRNIMWFGNVSRPEYSIPKWRDNTYRQRPTDIISHPVHFPKSVIERRLTKNHLLYPSWDWAVNNSSENAGPKSKCDRHHIGCVLSCRWHVTMQILERWVIQVIRKGCVVQAPLRYFEPMFLHCPCCFQAG